MLVPSCSKNLSPIVVHIGKQVNARIEADVVLLDEVVAVFRSGADVHLYVVRLFY